jgi:superfamily II DNA/RNA helicase
LYSFAPDGSKSVLAAIAAPGHAELSHMRRGCQIFVATKHHVEYVHALLAAVGVESVMLYGTMDPAARKISIGKFRAKLCQYLVVTDVAARGVDIPLLENVINHNFPSKGKLFVHRVGRAARAGRAGTAYSLVSPEVSCPRVYLCHIPGHAGHGD